MVEIGGCYAEIYIARNAYNGMENVFIDSGCIIKTNYDDPNKYELSRFPNAIFFPMTRGIGDVKLVFG